MKKFLLIVMLTFTLSIHALAGNDISAKHPLYADSTGWKIWSCVPAGRYVNYYLGIVNQMKSAKADFLLPDGTALAVRKMASKPQEYYGLVLLIPEGMKTFWNYKSKIELMGIVGKDTLSVISDDFLITNKFQTILIEGSKVKGYAAIPSSAYEILSTRYGNPILFVHFPLRRVFDKVLDCKKVENVVAVEGGEP